MGLFALMLESNRPAALALLRDKGTDGYLAAKRGALLADLPDPSVLHVEEGIRVDGLLDAQPR